MLGFVMKQLILASLNRQIKDSHVMMDYSALLEKPARPAVALVVLASTAQMEMLARLTHVMKLSIAALLYRSQMAVFAIMASSVRSMMFASLECVKAAQQETVPMA